MSTCRMCDSSVELIIVAALVFQDLRSVHNVFWDVRSPKNFVSHFRMSAYGPSMSRMRMCVGSSLLADVRTVLDIMTMLVLIISAAIGRSSH